MVGLPWSSFSFSCCGAGSPTLGTGATCFAGGVLKDWNSCENISAKVGAMFKRLCYDIYI